MDSFQVIYCTMLAIMAIIGIIEQVTAKPLSTDKNRTQNGQNKPLKNVGHTINSQAQQKPFTGQTDSKD